MAGRGDSWTTIESDPGVFTELIQQIGVSGVQVEELYSLDAESLQPMMPVYGLIFLFKWRKESDSRPVERETTGKVFFASQVINNACATQAIVSVLMNCPQLDLGSELTKFKEFTADFPPELKGLAIGNSDQIRTAHNSFARPEPIVMDDTEGTKDDDAFHFISYVPIGGTLYELDGLKEGPIALCQATEHDWLQKVGPMIQQRIDRYAKNEIRFNLLAVIKDRLQLYSEQMQEAQSRRDSLAAAVDATANAETAAAAPADSGLPSDPQQLQHMLAEATSDIHRLEEAAADEQRKRQSWHAENVRRRHNYIPFLFNFLKMLGEKQQLTGLIDAANKKASASTAAPMEH